MLLISGTVWAFTEPEMVDYTATPAFTPEAVPPNIMIVLDNSGSMNLPAYDETYAGQPYADDDRYYQLVSMEDDAEEISDDGSGPDGQLWDLDLGEHLVGLRFQGINIPQGAEIQNAYIIFTAKDTDSPETNLVIDGEDSDDALPFDIDDPDNIKNRAGTSATVAWGGTDLPGWTAEQRDANTTTPDLTAIVQEIVNRPGWAEGNAMAFRISGTGERDAYPADPYSGTTITGKQPVLYIDIVGNQGKQYYGYFNPDYLYSYSNNIFTAAYKKIDFNDNTNEWTVLEFFPEGGSDANGSFAGSNSTITSSDFTSQGLWDGNWANWLSMRRIDVLRKVLVGGYSQSRQGGGKQTNLGEAPANDVYSESYNKSFNSSVFPVSPYNGSYTYTVDDGNIERSTASYTIKIQKEPVIEPQDFTSDGELGGVLQRIDEKARWGNTWFNDGYKNSGGTVDTPIENAAMSALISNVQSKPCNTNTPLAETLYVVTQYFKQEDPASGLGYPNQAVPIQVEGVKDPYYDSAAKEMLYCAKSFVIMLTDGESTRDSYIPSSLKDTDGDNDYTGCTGDCGTDFLDDVAFYARTTDLRSATVGGSELEGDQNLYLYTVFAFDDSTTARNLLQDASKNGGFEDRNGNNKPDLDVEWDEDGDGFPDTYFEASDGYALEKQLLNAITDILKRASSGTAASVLATNNQGSGNSVQAYFKPLTTVGLDEARWLGYMQSLWVDPWGNLREDTNGDLKLGLRNTNDTNTAESDVDLIVEFYADGSETKLRRYTKHYLYNPNHGSSDECDDSWEDCDDVFDVLSMDESRPLFEAASRLAAMDPDDRKIFTYIDADTDGAVDDSGTSFDSSGEVVAFSLSNSSAIGPYLGVADSAYWGTSGARLGSGMSDRVSNIINWVRGTDIDGLRNRTLDGETWPLGDIINSTPMMVALPKEYYHELYEDLEYLDFIQYAQERETVIYVGANDGMMHAFTNWVMKKDNNGNIWYEKPAAAGSDEQVGDEIWAFIPQAVLPHLKWTAHDDYTHTYYVNGPPRVFDAKILADDTYYADDDSNPNFGTFMVFGLNMGGKEISVNEDFGTGSTEVRTFAPTYVMLDITEPRNPKLIWERSYDGLGMSAVTPSPVHIGPRDGSGEWYLVFGSGPTEYDGTSSQKGHFFVVDMATGEPLGAAAGDDWIWESTKSSYINEPLVLDLYQSHDANTIFFSNTYDGGSKWVADIYKIAVPCTKCMWGTDSDGNSYSVEDLEYNSDPTSWVVSKFFEADGPVSVQLSSTIDPLGNLLVYFGTGRFMSETDQTDTNQQYLYCVKDPFYNLAKYGETSYYANFSDTLTLDTNDLFDSSTAVVSTSGKAYSDDYGLMDFWEFVSEIRYKENGWYIALDADGAASERVVTQTSILGGIAITPVFTPSVDLCGLGGLTNFVGAYYETGTGYVTQLFDITDLQDSTIAGDDSDAKIVEIRDDDYYGGMPAPKSPFHAGLEGGARISTQVGTGEFVNIEVDPALYFKSITTEWWDDPDQAFTLDPACDAYTNN